MGKTTFLKLLAEEFKRLHQKGSIKNIDELYYVSLSSLLSFSQSNRIDDSCYNARMRNCYIFSYIYHQFGKAYNDEKRYLFLLDGFNELLERSSSQTHSLITTISREIALLGICFYNISVVMTSRKVPELVDLTGFARCSLSAVRQKDIEACLNGSTVASDEIKRLLTYPLYLRFFSEYISSHPNANLTTKYELLERIHEKSYKQAAEHKNFTEFDLPKFVYYAYVPMLARKMELNRLDKAERSFANDLYKQLRRDSGFTLRLINTAVDDSMVNLTLPESYEPVWDIITDRFVFGDSQDGGKSFTFSHQDIREYFAAFAVINDLVSVGKAYKDGTLMLCHPDFNFKAGVQELVSSAFGIQKDPAEGADPENFAAIFRDRKEKIVIEGSDKEVVRNKIINEILMADTAYVLEKDFELFKSDSKHREALHRIVSPVVELCERNIDTVLGLDLPDEIVGRLTDIVCSETQYYRNVDLSKCRRFIECAQKLVPNTGSRKLRVENQRAKALIKNSQNIFCSEDQLTEKLLSRKDRCPRALPRGAGAFGKERGKRV